LKDIYAHNLSTKNNSSFIGHNKFITIWSSGIGYAGGMMGREIESRQGIGWYNFVPVCTCETFVRPADFLPESILELEVGRARAQAPIFSFIQSILTPIPFNLSLTI
jgi:hypothetical protein